MAQPPQSTSCHPNSALVPNNSIHNHVSSSIKHHEPTSTSRSDLSLPTCFSLPFIQSKALNLLLTFVHTVFVDDTNYLHLQSALNISQRAIFRRATDIFSCRKMGNLVDTAVTVPTYFRVQSRFSKLLPSKPSYSK